MGTFLPLLLRLLYISVSLPLTSPTPLDAVAALSAAGHTSMSLLLNLTFPTLLPPSPSTLFSPSDTAFLLSGQPPLSLLRLHMIPQHLPPSSLPSSLHGVPIFPSPLHDDGVLIVYSVDRFFDPNFVPSDCCRAPPHPLAGAINSLRSKGYSAMAAALHAQIGGGFEGVTVFAPTDRVDFVQHLSVVRHTVPCRIDGRDLDERATMPTFEEGFEITVKRVGGRKVVNGVSVIDVGLYDDGRVVVHGIADVLRQPLETEIEFGL